MENIKLRQVTDTIHGTIFLSDLEAALISTPYFYRLHDIYQSSTVYMTYPTNRTKRYEHSLGVMQLASRMLYSAITNADKSTQKDFFNEIGESFWDICEMAVERSNDQNGPGGYYSECKNSINALFPDDEFEEFKEEFTKALTEADESNVFQDSALDVFQYSPMTASGSSSGMASENYFFYRCLLQAVRIVALFHDVGHPPYSHIIEEVLQDLYEESLQETCQWAENKKGKLQRALRQYVSKNSSQALRCNSLYTNKSLLHAATHERIGFSMLQHALRDIIPSRLQTACDANYSLKIKRIMALYYINIAEFALAILAETNPFFESIHRIVDGVIDADRLDYICRDSCNSGVDWGTIPYDRIINPVRLFKLEGVDSAQSKFVLAYPTKVSDDLIDLLIVRYKLFARINFHHGCMKNALALQTAVKLLAEDYLSTDDDSKCVAPGINVLWTALGPGAGNMSLRVIQWNDSWLISVLYQALVVIKRQNIKPQLRTNLEEILLNRKKYISVIKRSMDSKALVNSALSKAELTEPVIRQMYEYENGKFQADPKIDYSISEIASHPSANATDTIGRLKTAEELKETGDLETLDTLTHNNLLVIFQNTLERLKQENTISDYRIRSDFGRDKRGLPEDDFGSLNGLYLYHLTSHGYELSLLDSNNYLVPQIRALEIGVPYIFIFVMPNTNERDEKKLVENVQDALAESIASDIKEHAKEILGDYYKQIIGG